MLYDRLRYLQHQLCLSPQAVGDSCVRPLTPCTFASISLCGHKKRGNVPDSDLELAVAGKG